MDLHRAKASDSYDSISREYYNDPKYAVALKQFNGGRALSSGGSVEVPPIHVLKKQFPGSISTGAMPAGGTSPDWATATTPAVTTGGARQPEFRPSRTGTFTVPAGGMTFPQIARQTLGTEQRWRDVWDLNPQFTRTDAALPAGTVVKLPSDAKIPE